MQHRTGEPVTSGETCDRTLSYFSVREWLTMSHIFETLCKLALQQLAGRPFWNVLDKVHGFWAFVIGEMRLAEFEDLIFRPMFFVFKHHERCYFLPVQFIRHTDHCRRGDRGMHIKEIVDLTGIDIFTATYDHVRLSVSDVEKAVGVAVADVPRVKPPVGEGFFGCLRILEIFFEYIWPPKYDLT